MSDTKLPFYRHWGVRLIALLVVLVAADVAAQIAFAQTVKLTPAEWHDVVVIAAAAAGGLFLLLVYTGLIRIFERRGVEELRPSAAPGGLIAGALLGFVLFSAVIAVLVFTGHGSVSVPPQMIFPAGAIAIGIISGVGEELVFRGALFRIVEERFGTLVGLAASAVLFGALHILNPGATVISSVAIALEAGLLLALAYTATRTLWLPIGLHFAWNFTEGGVYSTAVSGGTVKGMLKTTLSGPDIITGGQFGPEASVVAVVLCLALALAFLTITLRRGRWHAFRLRSA